LASPTWSATPNNGVVDLLSPISCVDHSGEWCNWQHSRFWFCYSGFDSLLPNVATEQCFAQFGCFAARLRLAAPYVAVALKRYLAPSSSGLGHYPLKVAARVRIPLGLLNHESARYHRLVIAQKVFCSHELLLWVSRCHQSAGLLLGMFR
jgi:hypothetical protein